MAVPDKVVTNDDLSKIVDTNDEWITSRTGIKERRISEGENTSDLGYRASIEAIKEAGLLPEDIEMIIVATITPDNFTPSVACSIQEKLGAINATCFDIVAACTGFIYALQVGSQFIKTGEYKNVLVIGSEVLSKFINWEDRNTCVLFGDGAGAAVLQTGKEVGIRSIYTGSDGAKGKFLRCPALPLKNAFYNCEIEEKSQIGMDGKEVFKFAVTVIVDSVDKVLKDSGVSLEDIKYIVPHQANIRIIKNAAAKLKISEDVFYLNLNNYGNTSSASIPIALDEMNKKGLLNKGDKLIMVGFGGGLTWGAALMEWTMENSKRGN